MCKGRDERCGLAVRRLQVRNEKTNSAEDIHQLVQKLGHDQIHLMGMDIGAMTAFAFATSYPESIRRLVISESVLPGFGLEELMDVAKGGSWHFGFHMQADLAASLVRGKEAEYLEQFWRHMSPINPLDQTLKAELISKFQLPGAMRAGFMHYEALLRDGEVNRMRAAQALSISMPVLILNGSHGLPQAPLLYTATQMKLQMRHTILENTGHTLAEDSQVLHVVH
ncbi:MULTISPECIES: alpha/beta fold hydrolase [Paenibacillus]|uniref:alpha/beta fold hydrolase n=1 Tax=Paenibacillus TaxID=44249 RepID=UPI0013E3F4BF|nr:MULTISPECIES: alpha/beta hydrolase [Paenibacillus]MCY9657751.1 alpha/beta hydrolase [Paenibacillus anseongense]